ncbi:MAG: SUMF1/EgtB/PvdO family nonheme iron enzyme, partial [Verrucomicrobiia bacterium]
GTRVLRGGSFFTSASNTRCATRAHDGPSYSHSFRGFRVAVGMEQGSARPTPTAAQTTPATVTQPPSGTPATPPAATPTPPRTAALTLPRSATTAAQSGQPLMTSIGMELLYIPPGEFLLGSTPEERAWALQNGCSADYVKPEGEAPRKTVVKQGFWLGKTEVTVGQWKQFVAATGYVTDGEKKGESYAYDREKKAWGTVKGANWQDPKFGIKLKDNHPACCISWNDAMAFCEWLNERKTKTGRLTPGFKVGLPTEAEWEYACRSGKQTKFWWGETKEGGDNRLNWQGTVDGFEFVAPVDHYGARGRNKFGLADMLGNVREWCMDAFDPSGARGECNAGAGSSGRVVRGGAFNYPPSGSRCAYRQSYEPFFSSSPSGFRVVVGLAR